MMATAPHFDADFQVANMLRDQRNGGRLKTYMMSPSFITVL